MTTTPTIRYVPLAHDLRNLIVDMTTSYGEAVMSMTNAIANPDGTSGGKTYEQWSRTRARRFKAILRLTRSLRDLAEKGA